MINRILINREECEVRVAFLEEQTLVELHTEKFDEQTIVNNLYRGRVQDVVPGLQAAFVDVGLERNMFLHFMDIREESKVLGSDNQLDAMHRASQKVTPGRIERRGRRPRMDPANQGAAPVRKGDEIIVQVVKDEIGGKAPRVTTNLALAGRYLVMLPFPSQEGGVSRKIVTGPDRARLKKLLSSIKSADHSFIVRTAGLEQSEEAIHKDADSLERLWENVLTNYKKLKGPGLIHNDHDLVARLVRDAFPSDFQEVICDDPLDAEEVRRHLAEHMPSHADRVRVYDAVENIFDAYGVEKQIERSMAHKVWLKSGGYLIIDENEALTAIDVNTGRFIGKKDQEKTSLRTNLEACEAIAQLIRMRDIGGIIVIDFIDMISRSHQEKVSEELRRHLRRDRAKLAIGKIGDFGLMMLTRKRQRISLHKQLHHECPYCAGSGYVEKPDEVFRKLKYEIKKTITGDTSLAALLVSVHPRMAELLRLRYRNFLARLKHLHGVDVTLREDPIFHLEDFQITPLRHPETTGVRLPLSRLAPDERVASVEAVPVDFVGEIAEILSGQFEPVPGATPLHQDEELDDLEPLDAADEDGEDSEPQQPAAPGQQQTQQEGGRRRRRRESSSERRARRLRARVMEQETGEPGATPQPVAAQAAPVEPAPEPDSHVHDEQDAPIVAEQSASGPSGDAEGEDAERRRTRRGTRGGRSRRRRDRDDQPEDQDAPAETPSGSNASAPAASAPPPEPKTANPQPASAPAEPAGPLPKIKLKVKRSAADLLLADIVDEIDKTVETLRTTVVSAVKPLVEASLKPEPVAVAEPKVAAVDPSPAAEEVKPAGKEKPVKKTTARRKAAPAEKKPAAKKKANAPAEEKPAKKAAPRKSIGDKTKAAAEPKKKSTASKSAGTATAARTTKKKATASKKKSEE